MADHDLTPAEQAAQDRLEDLLQETLTLAAPGIGFSWDLFDPHREPGAVQSAVGMQIAARQLDAGTAAGIRDRVVNSWETMGATLEPPRNAGVRATFEGGYVMIVNAGTTAVVIDAGSPPLPI